MASDSSSSTHPRPSAPQTDIQQLEDSEPKKTASSVHDHSTDKPPFGSRFLTNDKDVWSKNAWDHVPPPDDQHDKIAASLARQRAMPIPEDEKHKYNDKPARHWDNFYRMNNENFFRDRKWLHTEFPELVATLQPNAGRKVVAELGCGAGNAVFPLLVSNKNPHLQLYACDYSSHAVKLVQRNPLYTSPPIGSISAIVWDLTSDTLPELIPPESVDIVVLIFVLSALHPQEWSKAIANIYKILKPGGLAVMRDYGRHDMTQLRFKGGRLLDDNFYIRGDKTRVYFFELDELSLLFTGSRPTAAQRKMAEPKLIVEEDTTEDTTGQGSTTSTPDSTEAPTPHSFTDSRPFDAHTSSTPPSETNTDNSTRRNEMQIHDISTKSEPESIQIHPVLLDSLSNTPSDGSPSQPLFTTVQLGIDRRLLINRKRQVKMYRVWMQGKFRKNVA